MSRDVTRERQQAHAYLDRLPSSQVSAVRSLLETMLPDPLSRALAEAPIENEEISEEENQAVVRSKGWFKNNEGGSFEDVAAELGLSMEQIRSGKGPA